jgi:hypothetical protein
METDPIPTSPPEPAPSRDGRDPSARMRVLAASAAVAALTAAVGLNAIVLTQGQATADTSGATVLDAQVSAAPLASAAPQASTPAGDAATAPAATAPATTTPPGGAAPQLGGQPPQRVQGPGHATSGGS